jgi:hypothetical protein
MADNGREATNPRQQSTTSRRRFLRATAGTASAALLPGLAGASGGASDGESVTNSDRADRIQRRALEIRNRTDSQARFKQFLANRADHFQSRQRSFTPESMRPDDPSTENWSEDAISTDLVLTYYYDSCTSGDPYAYFDYYITVDSDYGSGEGGPDQHSIGWADHHYRYEQDSAYHDSDMDNLSLKKESLNGVDWEWEDGTSCGFGWCGTKDYYVGCKAQLLETDQERGLDASYWDMWEEAKVESVSFSSSGDVSFTFTTEGRVDQYGYQIREDSDAYSGCW